MHEAIRPARVLLVEDNVQVRNLMLTMLQEEGLTVTACASGEAALEQVSHGEPPDLLITDLVMGGISGVELARLVRRRLPRLGVVFVSGYTEESQDIELATDDANVQFLEKPFRRAVLMEKISLAMRGQPTV
jgi:CheY-like chemotaxis protein